MRRAETSIGCLSARIVGVAGTASEFDDVAESEAGIRLIEREFGAEPPHAAQFHLRGKDGPDLSLVWVPEHCCLGTLTHECVHAAVELLKPRRIPALPEGNSELLAYVVGWLVDELSPLLLEEEPEKQTKKRRGRRRKEKTNAK